MKSRYLGERDIKQKNSPFKDYTQNDWALYYLGSYGTLDSKEHKNWAMDQVARILHGSSIEIKVDEWEGLEGELIKEYTVSVVDDSITYNEWKNGLNESDDYKWEEGTIPLV